MSRPRIIVASDPYLIIEEGIHPCITSTFSGGDFIPNDTIIGINQVCLIFSPIFTGIAERIAYCCCVLSKQESTLFFKLSIFCSQFFFFNNVY